MAVSFSLMDARNDVIYGLLIGTNYRRLDTGKVGKTWWVHLYVSERGRRQGLSYQIRAYPNSDMLTFEIKAADLFDKAKLVAALPREISHRQDHKDLSYPQQNIYKRGEESEL